MLAADQGVAAGFPLQPDLALIAAWAAALSG